MHLETDNTPSTAIPTTVKRLGAVSFLNDTSSEMIYPIIPLFMVGVLQVPLSIIGVIEGIVEGMASLLRMLSGWWSDRVGRRKPLVVAGYGLSTASRLVLAAATVWPVVFAARLLDRFGKGTRTAARDAWIADVTPLEIRGKAFGYHRSFDTIGAVVGPLIAALLLWVLPENYRIIFLISFVPGVLALIVLLRLPERPLSRDRSPDPAPTATPKTSWKSLPRPLWIFLMASTLFALGNSSDVFLLLRGKDLGWSSLEVTLAYALYNLTYALTSYPAGWLSDRLPRQWIVSVGWLIFAGSYLTTGLLTFPDWLWLIFALYGVSVGCTEGVGKALLADLAPKEMRASVYGLLGLLTSVAGLLASIWFGVVWGIYGAASAFSLSASLAVISALSLIWISLVRKRSLENMNDIPNESTR